MKNIRRELTAEGICILTFDRAESSANIFDRATLEELDAELDALDGSRGLIFTSAKDAIFVAGADLHSIKGMSMEDLRGFIELGQRVFNKIVALRIPTVAAIHGVALGGGYELCLACDYRVASNDRATRVGLPETQLGILPAWGGCTRLPKLIGVPKALDIILGGKTAPARQGLKLGLVDELVSREYLLRVAKRWLAKGKRKTAWLHSLPVNAVLSGFAAPKARADIEKRTHGHYPAITKALEVVTLGASESLEAASLARERDAILELVPLETTKNLLRLFSLQERAKKLTYGPASTGKELPFKNAAVIGAGIMGAGIAQWLSARGIRTVLRDVDPDRVAAGMGAISKLYADGVRRRTFTAVEARSGLERIAPASTEVPLHRVDVVIEAAVEKMEIKKTIFQRLDDLTRPDAVLATNSSALSITELARATRHPGRVVGIHFFNPVHKMQLVEVVRGEDTAPETVQGAVRFVQKIGKLPVVVKDSPGFLVNRILLPYMIEAGALFEAGAAVEDIDAAMLAFGMPMGPLRLIDEVGVDISEHVAATLSRAFPDRMRIPAILPRMIQAGLLGRKNGKGFYVHPKGRGEEPHVNPAVLALRQGGGTWTREELQRRMVLLMVNEAARCLEEGLVDTPGDVDFAMVMGTGFAPFRGGPLRYADHAGLDNIRTQLAALAGTAGPAFTPCSLLETRPSFYED